MALKFAKGDIAQLDLAVPTGPIVAFKMDSEGNVSYLLEWVDNDERVQQRWFAEDELRLV
jgi:hypothetical protein